MASHASSNREQKRSYLSQGSGSMFDDKNRKIPRPMNAFMIFAAENRSNFKEEYPEENNKDISVRLGEAWRRLPKVQREAYYEKAKEEEREHKKKFPNYVYCPGVARQRKKERLAEKARLDAILKAEIDSVLSETRSRRLGDDLSPIPGFMGGSNGAGSLQDMDLFSFGQPYPQAGTPEPSMQMFASPQGAGYSPYRQGPTTTASASRRHPYALRERRMPVSHYPQPMSHSRPYYPSPYGQMPPGATHPRQMPPLHRPPYPYPMPHGRPPYMMQGTPAGHYQHFDRAHKIDPGMMYRPWQPQFNQGQVIGGAISFKRDADEVSSHSKETISRGDSPDDARQHCTTPSDTSQEAQPDVFLPMQTADTASSALQLEATEVRDNALPGMQTFIQIPILSSNPDDTSGGEQVTELSANAVSSKATLLSLNGHGPPYNLVMAHYPQAHFGNPDKRLQRGEAYSFALGSETVSGVPFGNVATSASDFVGVPQFYAMKRTPNKHGESGTEMMMSPIRLEQPFYTDRSPNESSPFNPKNLPNEFIEQIAKQFYLLQGQGGEKLLQSPIVIASPRLGRGQHSSPAQLILSPAQLVSSPARHVPSPVCLASADRASDPEHPVPVSVRYCEEKLSAASDVMEVKDDAGHIVQISAAASVDQESSEASPRVKEPEDTMSVATNEEKPFATASSAMEMKEVPEAAFDDQTSTAQIVDKKVEEPIVLSSPASEGDDKRNQRESPENANTATHTNESDKVKDVEIIDISEMEEKVQDKAASIDMTDGIDGDDPPNHLSLGNAQPPKSVIADDTFASDQPKEKVESVGETQEGPPPMITESVKDVAGDLAAKTTPDGCGDGPQQQRELVCDDPAVVNTVQ